MLIRSYALAAMATLLLAGQAAAAAPAPPPRPPAASIEAARADLAEGHAKFEADDAAGARDLLGAVVASPKFAALAPSERRRAMSELGRLDLDADAAQAGYDLLKRASEMDETDSPDWHGRLRAAAMLKNDADALICIQTIARRWSSTLDQVRDGYILELGARTNAAAPLAAARLSMIAALADARWAPEDVALKGDDLWLDLATRRLLDGDRSGAAAAANLIVGAEAAVKVRSVKAFDPIVAGDPARWEIGGVMKDRLDRLRTALVAAPDDLHVVNALAWELIEDNQPGEALTLAGAAITRAQPAAGGPGGFKDVSELNVALEAHARALLMLGRVGESETEMRAGARRTEHGEANVSQVLDLALFLDEIGRPKDALAEIQSVGDSLSGFGRMVREEARGCALAQLGDKAGLAVSLRYLSEHQIDGQQTYIWALLCADDLDGAAQAEIRQLRDPRTLADALFNLQTFADGPHLSGFWDEFQKRGHALKERPDVRTAVEAVGRIGSYPQLPAQDL